MWYALCVAPCQRTAQPHSQTHPTPIATLQDDAEGILDVLFLYLPRGVKNPLAPSIRDLLSSKEAMELWHRRHACVDPADTFAALFADDEGETGKKRCAAALTQKRGALYRSFAERVKDGTRNMLELAALVQGWVARWGGSLTLGDVTLAATNIRQLARSGSCAEVAVTFAQVRSAANAAWKAWFWNGHHKAKRVAGDSQSRLLDVYTSPSASDLSLRTAWVVTFYTLWVARGGSAPAPVAASSSAPAPPPASAVATAAALGCDDADGDSSSETRVAFEGSATGRRLKQETLYCALRGDGARANELFVAVRKAIAALVSRMTADNAAMVAGLEPDTDSIEEVIMCAAPPAAVHRVASRASSSCAQVAAAAATVDECSDDADLSSDSAPDDE